MNDPIAPLPRIFICLFLTIACCWLNHGQVVKAQEFTKVNMTDEQWQAYEKQLNAILKTRRDQEKVFVKKVVDRVREGRIPPKLVATSFQWGRNKRPNSNFPFVYFERVLRLQAKRVKLEKEIPPFDYSIYGSAGQRVNGQYLIAGEKTQIQQKSSGLSRSAGQRR
jgi:hypothetical protein